MANRGGFGLPVKGTVSSSKGGQETLAVSRDANGSTIVDLNAGNVHIFILKGSVTLVFTGAVSGKACSLSLVLVQDATGGRAITWPSSVKWLPAGVAPTFTTTLNTTSIVELFTVDGGIVWYAGLSGTGIA